MQISKELLDNDILQTQSKIEQAMAATNQLAGALAVLKNMRKFLDEIEADKTNISAENKVIQDADQQKEADPVADKIVNANGQYVEKVNG